MSEAKDARRWRTSENFLLRRIAGEAVLVPVGDTAMGNSMITVNETFGFLWELFSQGATFEQAVAKAKEEYEDMSGQIEAHVASFLHDCTKYGMIIEEEN